MVFCDAISRIQKLMFDFQTVIPNAHLIINLLGLVLRQSLVSFDIEYFQHFFGIIMGTNVAFIVANIYVAMLENELRRKCKLDPKLKWPVLLKRFIGNGFGIFYGIKEDILYWIKQFNVPWESIKIDKWSIGNKIGYMDLEIFKGSRFHSCGKTCW